MSIDGRTRLYGVIGDPIEQVRGPQLLNPIFQSLGSAVVTLPMHVPAADLVRTWEGLRNIKNLAGVGLTTPHKVAAAELCDILEPAAKMIGAVNCVRRDEGGTMRGTIFDGIGFLEGLRKEGRDTRDRSVLLLGAGGAAIAIAFAVANAGVAKLSITNRTMHKAEALAERIKDSGFGECVATSDSSPKGYDIVINATSVGMKPSDPVPLDPYDLRPSMLVCDIILKPEVTPLLSAAVQRGCTVHYGRHMLDGQVNSIVRYIENLE